MLQRNLMFETVLFMRSKLEIIAEYETRYFVRKVDLLIVVLHLSFLQLSYLAFLSAIYVSFSLICLFIYVYRNSKRHIRQDNSERWSYINTIRWYNRIIDLQLDIYLTETRLFYLTFFGKDFTYKIGISKSKVEQLLLFELDSIKVKKKKLEILGQCIQSILDQ